MKSGPVFLKQLKFKIDLSLIFNVKNKQKLQLKYELNSRKLVYYVQMIKSNTNIEVATSERRYLKY